MAAPQNREAIQMSNLTASQSSSPDPAIGGGNDMSEGEVDDERNRKFQF